MVGRRVGLAVLAILLMVSACASPAATGTGAPPASIGPTPVPTPNPLTAVRHPMSDFLQGKRLVKTFTVGGRPDWQVFSDGALWVATGDDSHVVRIAAATNTIVTKIVVTSPCFGLAAGFGAIWAPTCEPAGVARIDPKTNTVVATIPLPALPYHGEGQIVATDDAIWLSTGDALARIDPATNAVTTVPFAGGAIASLVWAGGSLWGTIPLPGQVVQLDPRGTPIRTIKVGQSPRFAAAGEGAVWTLNQGRGDVTRIDPATGTVVATIDVLVPGEGGCIAAGAGGVWVTMPDNPFSRIDPATNTVTEQYYGDGGDCIGVGAGSVWLSNNGSGTVWRLTPP